MADEKSRTRGGDSPLAPIAVEAAPPVEVVILDADSPMKGRITTMPATEAAALIGKGKARAATTTEIQFGARA